MSRMFTFKAIVIRTFQNPLCPRHRSGTITAITSSKQARPSPINSPVKRVTSWEPRVLSPASGNRNRRQPCVWPGAPLSRLRCPFSGFLLTALSNLFFTSPSPLFPPPPTHTQTKTYQKFRSCQWCKMGASLNLQGAEILQDYCLLEDFKIDYWL